MTSTTKAEHPGVFVGQELEKRGWSQADLAFVLGFASSTISMLVSGKKDVNANLAKMLGKAFDVPADHLLNLQKQYDLAHADEPDAALLRRARVHKEYPLREMIKRGWIDGGKDSRPPEEQLARFFRVESIDEVPHMRHAAKRTKYEDVPPKQLAWLFRVSQLANDMVVPSY